jgi:RimJ/RimL family protein N-acetyltransferase
MQFRLETERLVLRAMQAEDVDHLLRIFSDPVAMRHYPSLIDPAGTRAWIQRTRSNYRRYGFGFWVVERKADRAFLGQCGIIPQTVDGTVEPEVAYLFVRDFWGQGYATEAAKACRDWGFEHLDVPRLISIISPANVPSIHVAERNGMRPVSTLMRPTGILHDVYAITRADWLLLRGPRA